MATTTDSTVVGAAPLERRERSWMLHLHELLLLQPASHGVDDAL